MRIVLAHGRAAQFEIPSTVGTLWKQALRRGLERVGRKTDIQIDYAYFGDLWRPDAYKPLPTFGLPGIPPPPPGSVEAVYDVEDGQISADGALASPQAAPRPARIADCLVNWSLTAPFMSQALRRAITDVYQYLEDENLYAAANKIVREKILGIATQGPPEEVVLVGFSLGSIVGYEVLRTANGSLPVTGFVTCGSPIGLAPVYEKLNAPPRGPSTPFPQGLRQWLNVWCADDVATGVHGARLAALFPSPEGKVIRSAQTWNRSPGIDLFAAHNPFDYLSSKAVGRAVDILLNWPAPAADGGPVRVE